MLLAIFSGSPFSGFNLLVTSRISNASGQQISLGQVFFVLARELKPPSYGIHKEWE